MAFLFGFSFSVGYGVNLVSFYLDSFLLLGGGGGGKFGFYLYR